MNYATASALAKKISRETEHWNAMVIEDPQEPGGGPKRYGVVAERMLGDKRSQIIIAPQMAAQLQLIGSLRHDQESEPSGTEPGCYYPDGAPGTAD